MFLLVLCLMNLVFGRADLIESDLLREKRKTCEQTQSIINRLLQSLRCHNSTIARALTRIWLKTWSCSHISRETCQSPGTLSRVEDSSLSTCLLQANTLFLIVGFFGLYVMMDTGNSVDPLSSLWSLLREVEIVEIFEIASLFRSKAVSYNWSPLIWLNDKFLQRCHKL